MTKSEIQKNLTSAFHDVFDDEDIVLSSDLTAQDVQEWDSLAHVRLMLTVEREFKVKFSAAEIANLKNVGELIDLIESKL